MVLKELDASYILNLGTVDITKKDFACELFTFLPVLSEVELRLFSVKIFLRSELFWTLMMKFPGQGQRQVSTTFPLK